MDWLYCVGIIWIISSEVSLHKSFAEVPGIFPFLPSTLCESIFLKWLLLLCKVLPGGSNTLAITSIWNLFTKWQSCKSSHGVYSLISGWSNCSQALNTSRWIQPPNWSPPRALFTRFGMSTSSFYH